MRNHTMSGNAAVVFQPSLLSIYSACKAFRTRICHLDVDKTTRIPILSSPIPPYVTLQRPPEWIEISDSIMYAMLAWNKSFYRALNQPSDSTECIYRDPCLFK